MELYRYRSKGQVLTAEVVRSSLWLFQVQKEPAKDVFEVPLWPLPVPEEAQEVVRRSLRLQQAQEVVRRGRWCKKSRRKNLQVHTVGAAGKRNRKSSGTHCGCSCFQKSPGGTVAVAS